MPEHYTVPPRALADAVDLRDLVRLGQVNSLVEQRVPNSAINAANGVCPLDGDGLVPLADLRTGTTSTTVARGHHGVPAGGGSGAIIVKRSTTDYDEVWQEHGVFQGRANAAQTIATANAWTPVSLQVEDFDDDNGHSTTTNISRFTAVRAGRYRVGGSAVWNSNTTTAGQRGARLVKNGTFIPGSQALEPYTASTNVTCGIIPMFVLLAVADYVEMQVFTSTANAQLFGSTTDGSVLVVELIGPN